MAAATSRSRSEALNGVEVPIRDEFQPWTRNLDFSCFSLVPTCLCKQLLRVRGGNLVGNQGAQLDDPARKSQAHQLNQRILALISGTSSPSHRSSSISLAACSAHWWNHAEFIGTPKITLAFTSGKPRTCTELPQSQSQTGASQQKTRRTTSRFKRRKL